MESLEEGILPREMPDDKKAFSQLVGSYGPMLARYVRCRITNPSDAEDILQETFVAVWLGFRRLRDPARMQGWLIHVAQNRCRDYFRAQEHQEMARWKRKRFRIMPVALDCINTARRRHSPMLYTP